jgi:DNA-binding transcriptional regulator YhcF (GntR family)
MSSPRRPLKRAESLHRQIARNIRNDIDAGVLRDGDVLPSTRDMAAQWATSGFTITEAMKLLADEGLIENQDRSKRVVRAPNQRSRNEIRVSRPQVIYVGGYAGSGKTELGRVLARLTGWPMLDKDTITRPVVEAALEMLGRSPHDRDSDFYFESIRPREYEALAAAAAENVQCGNSAIITAPFIKEFTDPAWLARTQASYEAVAADMTIVWMHCDAEAMHTYVRHRGAARDTAKLGDWSGYLAKIDVGFRPSVPHVVIDNCVSAVPLQRQAQDLLKQILDKRTA